jgi:PleD family two-component response regulator
MERVRIDFREELFTSASGPFRATTSTGLVRVRETGDVHEAVERADQMLYVAKAVGRDRVISEDHTIDTPTRTILLAEDDDLTAALVMHRLVRQEFTVVHRRDGGTALQTALSGGVNLCLLDAQMPVMGGFELLGHLSYGCAFDAGCQPRQEEIHQGREFGRRSLCRLLPVEERCRRQGQCPA